MRGISWLAERTLSFSRRTLLHGVSYSTTTHRRISENKIFVNRVKYQLYWKSLTNNEYRHQWNGLCSRPVLVTRIKTVPYFCRISLPSSALWFKSIERLWDSAFRHSFKCLAIYFHSFFIITVLLSITSSSITTSSSRLCSASSTALRKRISAHLFLSVLSRCAFAFLQLRNNSRIWGSHGGEYEDCCLLGCSTV
jgi:hypothetical protein